MDISREFPGFSAEFPNLQLAARGTGRPMSDAAPVPGTEAHRSWLKANPEKVKVHDITQDSVKITWETKRPQKQVKAIQKRIVRKLAAEVGFDKAIILDNLHMTPHWQHRPGSARFQVEFDSSGYPEARQTIYIHVEQYVVAPNNTVERIIERLPFPLNDKDRDKSYRYDMVFEMNPTEWHRPTQLPAKMAIEDGIIPKMKRSKN